MDGWMDGLMDGWIFGFVRCCYYRYCGQAHGLPRSLALLHELARRNSWVLFLHEAQREACGLDVTIGVVRHQFRNRSLRGHLLGALLYVTLSRTRRVLELLVFAIT